MVIVSIPSSLRRLTQGESRVTAAGEKVRDVLADLEARYPGILAQICDKTGLLRRFVKVFFKGEDIQSLQDLDTPVHDRDEISIVMAISGG